MTALWIGLAALALIVLGLGHWRLVDHQADVAAAHRQMQALVQQRAATTDPDRRAMLTARIEATRRIHAAEVTRWQATPGARLNRWRPAPLPEEIAQEITQDRQSG